MQKIKIDGDRMGDKELEIDEKVLDEANKKLDTIIKRQRKKQ